MSRQINLFDESLRPRRPPLDAATMAIALLVVAASLLGYQQYAKREFAALEARRASTEAQVKNLQTRLAQLGGKSRTPDKALEDEISRTETQLKSWQQLLDRLRGTGIGNTEGHAKFLEALARQHADGVWLTKISVGEGGAEFALKGRVVRPELLAGYIQLLNREEALRGRAIGQMDVSEKIEAGGPAGAPSKADAVPKDTGREARFVEFSIASNANASETGGAR